MFTHKAYEIISESREWLNTILEAGVLWILIKEFLYDKDKFERQEQRKRKKKELYDGNIGEHK